MGYTEDYILDVTEPGGSGSKGMMPPAFPIDRYGRLLLLLRRTFGARRTE
jgi:hypothetical protein